MIHFHSFHHFSSLFQYSRICLQLCSFTSIFDCHYLPSLLFVLEAYYYIMLHILCCYYAIIGYFMFFFHYWLCHFHCHCFHLYFHAGLLYFRAAIIFWWIAFLSAALRLLSAFWHTPSLLLYFSSFLSLILFHFFITRLCLSTPYFILIFTLIVIFISYFHYIYFWLLILRYYDVIDYICLLVTFDIH